MNLRQQLTRIALDIINKGSMFTDQNLDYEAEDSRWKNKY